jgi:hypothetical protein
MWSFLQTPMGGMIGVLLILGIGVVIYILVKNKITAKYSKEGGLDIGWTGSQGTQANLKLDEILKKVDLIDTDVLRLTIYNTEMSLQDRDKAFGLYSKKGNNGQTASYYKKKILPLIEKQYEEDTNK